MISSPPQYVYTSYNNTQNVFFFNVAIPYRFSNENDHKMMIFHSYLINPLSYNYKIAMNNIRFTGEQASQNLEEKAKDRKDKEKIGFLISKYERKGVVDQEQQTQVEKKKLVYHGNSLNYSQIYSDLRIDRREKKVIQPPSMFTESNSQAKALNKNNQIQFQSAAAYIPKSLPKIRRNSRLTQHKESKYVINNTLDQSNSKDRVGLSRTKVFSISHYDIYKNDVKKQELIKSQKTASQKKGEECEFFGQGLSSPKDASGSNLKVSFENKAQNSLPQENDIFQASNSTNFIPKPALLIQPEHSLQQLNKDEIKIQRNLRKQSTLKESKGPLIKSNFIKQQIHDAEQQKQEQFILNGLRRSGQSSVRSRNNKEIRVQEIKRKYSKKLEKLDKKSSILLQQHQSSQFLSNKEKKSIEIQDLVSQEKPKTPMKQSGRQRIKEPKKDSVQKEAVSSIRNSRASNNKLQHSLIKQTQGIETKQIKLFHPRSKQQQQLSSINSNHHQGPKEQISARGSKSRDESIKQHQQSAQKVEGSQQKQNSTSNNEQARQQKQELASEQAKIQATDTNRTYQFRKFNINDYIEVYQILKRIQKTLKLPLLDLHSLIKEAKKYLQVIAMGGLDHLQGYEMPLHRLKIIKNALLYQRISVVIIAFAYAVGKIKDCLKYLINLVGYATNNTLLILKILEGTEINSQSKNIVLAKSDKLVLKRNYDTIRNNSDIILDSIFKISKYEQAFYQPFKDILKSIGKNSIEQTFYNILQYFSFFLCVSDLYKNLPFLAVAPNPYLRQSIDPKPTLVIDIIQVFCQGTKKSKNHVFRPHTQHFLNEMGQYYQIISFTCAYPNQIDKVIDILDQKKNIKHRLYRHHALMGNNMLYKDPQRIGRDLSKLILLDSQTNLLKEQCTNTIIVPVWKGNKSDTTLAELCPILAAISLKKLDCREATKRIHDQQLKNQNAGIKYLNFGINLE